MSIGKRCVFQLSSISIRILSHTLILRLGYTFLILHSKTSRASRQGWVRQSADRPYEPKFHEANKTVIMSFGKRFPFPVFVVSISQRTPSINFDSAKIEFDYSIGVTVEKTFSIENKKPLKPR